MCKFQQVIRSGLLHKRIVNFRGSDDRPHGDNAVGQLFGHVQNVGHHSERIGSGHSTAATKTGNHLIKNKQNMVLVTELT